MQLGKIKPRLLHCFNDFGRVLLHENANPGHIASCDFGSAFRPDITRTRGVKDKAAKIRAQPLCYIRVLLSCYSTKFD